MEKSINEKNHKEVKTEVFPEMTAEEAKERTMEEIRRVVRILTVRVETEMPDELYAAARSLSKLFDSEVLSRG